MNRTSVFLLTTVGLLLGLLLREPLGELFAPKRAATPTVPAPAAPSVVELPPVPPKAPSIEELKRRARDRAAPHLEWADRESQRAIDEHVKALNRYFAGVKKRTPRFADEVLGWGSKWRLVSDKLPFTRDDRHQEFLKEKFREHLFTPEALEGEVRRVVQNYLESIRGIEDVMLVRVREDVSDLPPALLVTQVDEKKLRVIFEQAMARASDGAAHGLCDEVVQQLVGLVVGEVLAQAAVRLGVSAGILGTGAASGWATFGIGVIVGLVVDQVISWVWDWYADPTGSLARDLDRKLDEIRDAIVDGTDEAPGLRQRLEQLARERARARRAAVLDVVQKTGGER